MTRLAAAALALWVALAAAPSAAPAEEGAAALVAAAEPVLRQLEAFRRDDFDTAYTFASREIREMFDRPAFERMVRTGYPEIARSTFAAVAEGRLGPDGRAFLRLTIRGANGQTVEAVYEMVREAEGWKINGVVARPAPGLV